MTCKIIVKFEFLRNFFVGDNFNNKFLNFFSFSAILKVQDLQEYLGKV